MPHILSQSLARTCFLTIQLMACMPIVLDWCITARGQEHDVQTDQTPKIDLFANVAKKYLSEPQLDRNENPKTEFSVSLQDGHELRVTSAKYLLRNAETGEIRANRHLRVVSLDIIRGSKDLPVQLWSFSSEQGARLLIDYTEPYGFQICTEFLPKLALAFLDDQQLYFAELDVTVPSRQVSASPMDEVVALSNLARKPFGTANYQPKFTVQEVTRRNDQWEVTVSIQGHEYFRSTFKRIAHHSWVEISLRGALNPKASSK